MTTPTDALDRLRELDKAATKAPWRHSEHGIEAGEFDEVIVAGPVRCMSYCYGGTSTLDGDRIDLDGDLIASVRNALPDLLTELEALRDANANLRSISNANGDWNLRFMQEEAVTREALARAEEAEESLRKVKADVLALADDLNRRHDGSLVTTDYPLIARRIRAVTGPSTAPGSSTTDPKCPTCGKDRDDVTPGPHKEGWGRCPESFHFNSVVKADTTDPNGA